MQDWSVDAVWSVWEDLDFSAAEELLLDMLWRPVSSDSIVSDDLVAYRAIRSSDNIESLQNKRLQSSSLSRCQDGNDSAGFALLRSRGQVLSVTMRACWKRKRFMSSGPYQPCSLLSASESRLVRKKRGREGWTAAFINFSSMLSRI